MSQKVCSKEELDSTLENLERGISICWDCVQTHYPAEFKQRNGLPTYRRRCKACGYRGYCTWAGLWRPLIYKGKTTEWLIEQFEKDVRFHKSLTGLKVEGSDAAWELVQRGKGNLPAIFNYLKDNSYSEKEEWFYFFEKFARHHKLLFNNSIFPVNFSEWEKLLTV